MIFQTLVGVCRPSCPGGEGGLSLAPPSFERLMRGLKSFSTSSCTSSALPLNTSFPFPITTTQSTTGINGSQMWLIITKLLLPFMPSMTSTTFSMLSKSMLASGSSRKTSSGSPPQRPERVKSSSASQTSTRLSFCPGRRSHRRALQL